jgi:hypothetical protein
MKNEMMDDDVENVGIMQGFLDQVGEEEDELEEEEGSEESSAARVLNRRPDSPEILMNNLRGDMRSVDARREELADLVGYDAAAETPDAVLAMLQPVLAQQGGLGALPQSGPMAQGPQPPMPPPSGGDMGAPPPGAPPLPPGGPPPPAGGDMAALLAAAGPPPGGGMAPGGPPGGPPPGAGPMIGPDGQPIPPEGMPPIQMKDGGLVQRFKNGSTEEGVTQADEEGLPEDRTSAANLLYSPELVDFAQMQAARTLAQRAAPVPTLKEAMASRLPEYESLLAPDKSASQSGLLFDIAGAALNFAANRGPRGEVLRGSPMARLAGAFSNLPAAVQKRVSDIEDTKRQLRLLALQAGEKDRDEIQNLNAKLATEQRSILNTVLTADARSRAAQMRSGVAAATGTRGEWEMNVFNTPGLIERFAAGQSTPQETNLVNSAITSWTQPKYQAVVDPVTRQPSGYQELPGNRLPDFVTEARRVRGSGVPTAGAVTLPRTEAPPSTTPPRSETPVETPEPLLSEGGREPTVAGTARPADRPVDEPNYLPREEAMASPVSLWRDRAKIAGPFATVYAGISQVPGLGDPMREITLARSQANLVTEEVVEAFLKSAQNSVTEQRMLQGVLQLKPALLKDPEAYGTQLIALSTMIDQALADNRAKADTAPGSVGATLAPDQVADARKKVKVLERVKSNLGLPPAVYSEEEIARLPPNVTEVLWMGVTPAKIRGR